MQRGHIQRQLVNILQPHAKSALPNFHLLRGRRRHRLVAVRIGPVAHRDAPVPGVGFDQQIIGRPSLRIPREGDLFVAPARRAFHPPVDPHQAFAAWRQLEGNAFALGCFRQQHLPLEPAVLPLGTPRRSNRHGLKAARLCLFRGQPHGGCETIQLHLPQRAVGHLPQPLFPALDSL